MASRKALALTLALSLAASGALAAAGMVPSTGIGKPTLQMVPYHQRLIDLIRLNYGSQQLANSGVVPAGLPVPQSMQVSALQAATAIYNGFQANLWNISTPYWTTGGCHLLTCSYSYWFRIKGNNPFTGERYDSGAINYGSKSGLNPLGALAVIGIAAIAGGFLGPILTGAATGGAGAAVAAAGSYSTTSAIAWGATAAGYVGAVAAGAAAGNQGRP